MKDLRPAVYLLLHKRRLDRILSYFSILFNSAGCGFRWGWVRMDNLEITCKKPGYRICWLSFWWFRQSCRYAEIVTGIGCCSFFPNLSTTIIQSPYHPTPYSLHPESAVKNATNALSLVPVIQQLFSSSQKSHVGYCSRPPMCHIIFCRK
jgi:hypothetical protein